MPGMLGVPTMYERAHPKTGKVEMAQGERHRTNRRRDSNSGTPGRVRGPPTPKDEFSAIPDIVLDSGKCKLHPDGTRWSPVRKKQGQRKSSPKVREAKTTRRSTPKLQRDSGIRASNNLQPLSDCRDTDYSRLLFDPRFFFVGAPSSVMKDVPANLLRSIRSTACQSLSRSVRHLPVGVRGIQRQEKAILPDGTVYEISTTWTYHAESASSTVTQRTTDTDRHQNP